MSRDLDDDSQVATQIADPVAQILSHYATQVDPTLGEDTTRALKQRILDSFGCAFESYDEEAALVARRYGRHFAGMGGCTGWGDRELALTSEAGALVNGVAVRYLDLNDSYFGLTGLHPSDMLAGIIAVGEMLHSSGQEVLLAAAIGYETAITLCDTLPLFDRGWDHVDLAGLGACCGIGRLMGLSEAQVAHALGIYVTGRAAKRQVRLGAVSMWKAYAAADAVRHAVYVCSLAKAGVRGPEEAFGGRHGYIRQILGEELKNVAVLRPLEGLAEPKRVLETHIKRWPFGYVAQSAVEAAELIHRELPASSSVVRIDITVFEHAQKFMARPEHWQPRTRETADHSLPYVVSEMIRRGKVDEKSFQLKRYASSDTHRYLQERVHVVVDEAFTARYPHEFPARVAITAADGSVLSHELAVDSGHASHPDSSADISMAKFRRAATRRLGEARAARLEAAVEDLDSLADISRLCRMTVPAR